jgi:WD40 repeat protein
MSPSEQTGSTANGDLLVAGARFDAFVSYRRIAEDTAFVDRLQAALAGRGKKVWVDRAEIEPASDWSERIVRGIEAAKAFIFVITPESAASQECRREYSMAVRRNKLVVPVVLRDVDRQRDLPEGVARLNWIFFSRGHDFDRALDEVVVVLEEDLDWRDAHARLGVRAGEWAGLRRDRSFLLRGSDLRLAEVWLGQATQHEKTPPTALQTEYILASRKDAARTQRTWRAALSAGLVVALALAAVAFVQRNQARSEARQADSRALAAEATADLSGDPEQSLELALSSMQIEPNGPGEQALRLALAQDRLRMAISSGTGSATLAAWNGRLDQVAVTAPHNSVALWSAATGRLTQILPTGHAVNQLMYDPSGSRLAAVSSAGYLTMWNISARGSASLLSTSQFNAMIQALTPVGARAPPLGLLMGGVWANDSSDEFDVYAASLPEVLAFAPGSGVIVPVLRTQAHDSVWGIIPSPDGSRLFVDGLSNGFILDLATGQQVPLSAPPGSPPGPACWFPDGSELVSSTSVEVGGPEQIYRAASGVLAAQMKTPAGPTTAVACSADAADAWVAAGDEAGNVILRLAGGPVVRLFGHSSGISAIASSPDGRYLATASYDGTARIWDAGTGQEVTDLDGDGAPLIGVQFGPTAGLVLTVDERGFVRIWDTGLGQPVTALQSPAQGQAVALGFARNGQQVVGADLVTSTGTASQVTSVSALTWNAQTGQLVRQVALPGIADADDPCSPTLKDDEGSMGTLPMLTGSDCGIPPPPNLVLAVALPRPMTGAPDFAVIELLPLAISPDNSYVAYARDDSVALLDSAGHQVAALKVDSRPTGLSFFDGSVGLLVMTDTAVYLWRPFSGSPPLVIRQASTPIDAMLSESGNRLAVAGGGTTVSVWNTASGRLIRTFTPPPLAPRFPAVPLRVALTADGDVVASGNSDGTVTLWNVATGKPIKVDTVSSYPIVELGAIQDGSWLVAVNYPEVVTGVTPSPTGEVLDASTGQVLATYHSPEGVEPDMNPGAALSADAGFLLAGANGLAPTPPGGTEAAYQVSTGQAMATWPAAGLPTVPAYSESAVQPWSPDDTEVIVGSAIYSCDACGLASTLEAAAASRLAWSQPLSQSSDHPPSTNPYG